MNNHISHKSPVNKIEYWRDCYFSKSRPYPARLLRAPGDGFRQVFFYDLRTNVLPAGAHADREPVASCGGFPRPGGTSVRHRCARQRCVAQRVADQRQIVVVRGIRIINIQQGGEQAERRIVADVVGHWRNGSRQFLQRLYGTQRNARRDALPIAWTSTPLSLKAIRRLAW